MKVVNPFEAEGNWYKGNIHLHTTNSDGALTPEETCKVYREAGYDFVVLTDHWKITPVPAVPPDFLALSGVEYHTGNCHIICLHPGPLLPEENYTAQEIIDRLNQQAGYPIIAHPYWSGITSQELLGLKNYLGIEVFNNTCENLKGKGYSSVHWDELLQAGRQVWGLAVDDSHHHPGPYRRDDLLKGFIMVRAKTLARKNILEAIEKGLFYSSTGVIIENITVADNLVSVQSSPAAEIDFVSYNACGNRFSGIRKEITQAEFTLTGQERYLRIEITDSRNQKAWTNPICLDL